jgi:predicted transcriptional regulator
VSDSDVGTLLRACRQMQGISARGLSLRAGLSASVVGKVEAGIMEPTLPVFAAIVTTLGLNAQEIAALVRMSARAQSSRQVSAGPGATG